MDDRLPFEQDDGRVRTVIEARLFQRGAVRSADAQEVPAGRPRRSREGPTGWELKSAANSAEVVCARTHSSN